MNDDATTPPPTSAAPPPDRTDRAILTILGVAFALRCVASFVGLDRLPYFSGDQEIYWSDVAIQLARHGEYRAPAIVGEWVHLDQHFTHHPPLFILVLAACVRLLGVSVATIRGPSVFFQLATTALVVRLLYRLRARGVITRGVLLCTALIAMGSLGTMFGARWGRPDQLAMFFAVGCLSFSLEGHWARSVRSPAFVGAALSCGLALLCHPQIVATAIAFALLVAIAWRASPTRSNTLRGLLLIATPSLLFLGGWGLTYRADTLHALGDFALLTKIQGYQGTSALQVVQLALAEGAADFVKTGGTVDAILVLSWILALATVATQWRTAHEPQRRILEVIGVLAVSYAATVTILTGFSLTRSAVNLPLALVVLALSTSAWTTPRARQRGVALLGAVATVEWALTAGAMVKLAHEWDERDPSPIVRFVDALPENLKIAATPRFWFALTRRGLPFELLDESYLPSKVYWQHHAPDLDGCDLILGETSQQFVHYEGIRFYEARPVPDRPSLAAFERVSPSVAGGRCGR